MFRAIVWAILFVELWIPLILYIIGSLNEDWSIGCLIFAIAIVLIIAIF